MNVLNGFKNIIASFTASSNTQVSGGLVLKAESSHMLERLSHSIIPQSNITTSQVDFNESGLRSNFSGMFVGQEDEYRSNGEILLTTAMSHSANSKRELLAKLDKIRDYDYIESTIRDLANDVLTKNYSETQGDFFTFRITSEDEKLKEYQDRIQDSIKNLQIYELLNDILEDLLFNGQYILKMDYENDELDDSLIQSHVMPAYSKTKLSKVYDGEKGRILKPKDFLVFTLFTSPNKLKVKSKSGSYYTLKMPRGIIPESIIPKINNLKLLEALQPLVEMQAIDEKMYFYVRFPPGKSANEAYKEARDYEKIIKSMLSMDQVNTVDEVIDRVSKVKVIPLFGTQDEIRPQTISKVNRIDLAQINDLRDSISNALKVNITGDNERNKEYYKLIKRLRSFLTKSLREFLVFYVEEKYGLTLKNDDFSLTAPDVKGVDELDNVDYISLAANSSSDVIKMIGSMNESLIALKDQPHIDHEFLVDYFNEKLTPITNKDIFIKDQLVINRTPPVSTENESEIPEGEEE